ncbi:uncharacterized protein LOC128217471 isoform X5 [Mya arenaria]|uniref:uncharacterized protein LOC128217471 isoform X5 n=1 Tax=Mya arenaria TaxID=6604 RepID=UPI0022E86E29|nr:uncharacterized protein LOC128217471 isoform X5 [Mya arenaria]
MSSETVAKTVGKKLRYYFEVKRLEDGFDLSGTHSPQLNHPPLKSRPTLQYDGLHDRALKHYFSQPDVKTRLTQMHPTGGDLREDDLRQLLKRYMYKYRFITSQDESTKLQVNQPLKLVGFDNPPKKPDNHGNKRFPWQRPWEQQPAHNKHPTMPEWMYRNHPTQGRTIKPELVGFGVGLKSQKHKRIKGGFPVMRSVPSSKVTRGEAHRLIDVATKILVATERVQDMKSRPGSPTRKPAAPAPFETSKPLPDNTRGQRKKRPSTAKYSWDIHGRRHVRVKEEEAEDGNHPHSDRPRSYDDSFIPDWIMTQKKEHPEPPKEERPKTPEPKPSPRPRSAKYRHREATVINVPEPSVRREVVVNQGSQTADDVGIQTEKKLLEEYDHQEDEVKDGPWSEYQVYVRTGDRVGAATKADVRITLYGERGRTKEICLGNSSRNKVKFQRGKEDIFLFPAHHVGKLRKIKIGHDRPDLSFAWFLDGVSVYDMHEKRIYEFVCADWLSGRDGDRQTYKELKLDCERAFVEAYDDVRERSYPQAGRDRRKDENSNESKASKNDKRSVESIQGSRGERHSDSDDTSTSYSSSSSSNSGRGRRLSPRSKTPTKPREPSPPRQAAKDDFFDAKVSGPTFTFRSSKEDEVIQEEYLSGYKAGLNAASAEQKQEHKKEDAAKKSVLKGPTVHDAARSGDLDRMQTLLNYYPEMKEAKDESGLTPLHVSTQQGRLDIVKWLTALGINLNTETQTGYTAIHLAAMNGHLNCMIVLAAMGAALTCRSVDKQTPLHVAAMNGHLECVKWLIANRASLTTEDQLGRTALALADEYQHKEVAEFIQKCIDEARDPSSSLYAMRSSRKGLGTIEEDSSPRQERSTMWQNDTNPDSACANVGSESEGRKAREKHNSQSVQVGHCCTRCALCLCKAHFVSVYINVLNEHYIITHHVEFHIFTDIFQNTTFWFHDVIV